MVTIKELPRDEYIELGHAACAGCGATIAIRHALKALGDNTILTVPACCMSVIQGLFPKNALHLPVLNTAFETAGAAASGIAAGLKFMGKEKDINVMAWAGDGGTYDIGIQALSGAAERQTNFIYTCYNNESYGNTGQQRSGATPYGAFSTTTPIIGKQEHRKPMARIMAEHGIPYTASISAAYPRLVYDTYSKAKDIVGTRFIEVHAMCPTGWRCATWDSVKFGKLAVETGIWIMWEKEGDEWRFLGRSKQIAEGKVQRKPMMDYLKPQGRFRTLIKDSKRVREFERGIEREWNILKQKVSC
ncbi:MAG: thiamine pyrophosphate-dependent enzyme [Promethearchaeota archaeon]